MGVAVAATSLAGSASAQEAHRRFGDPGFVISADRLLPLLSYQSIRTSVDGASETQSRLSIALMNSGPFEIFSSFYNLPRLSVDWLPVRNLTIGTAAWLYTDLQSTQSTSPAAGSSTSKDQPKVTYWGVAPRVGYVLAFSPVLALWPRAGVEYHNVSSSDVGNGSGSITQFAFDAEAMLVISPWTHFGITVGPTVDVPITGEQTTTSTPTAGGTSTSTRVDSAMFQVGMSAGLLGYF